MKINSDYLVSTNYPHMIIPNMAEKVGHLSLDEPAIVMALLNFKLSFDLLDGTVICYYEVPMKL